METNWKTRMHWFGDGFFLIRFGLVEDYDNALKGNPWFIGDCRYSILYPYFNLGRWLEWSFIYPKNYSCITCINSFITYHKNDLEILMAATVCLNPKLDHRNERYHEIKFSRSACIVWGETYHVWLIEINFDWLMIKIN